jgi:hypothetical protein
MLALSPPLTATAVAFPAHAGPFVPVVTNPWLPLLPGTTWTYRGRREGGPMREVVSVPRTVAVVDGVRCAVVRDRLYQAGRLAERTTDYYAQDRAGTVWYFGEDTAKLAASGVVRSRTGSWRAGVRGAKAGVFMPAHPRPGQTGRQESLAGQAEDHFRVLGLDASAHSPAVSSTHALLIREWTPLEPGVVDHRWYVKGVGTVREQTVRGGDELAVLVSVSRIAA